jgi:ribosomal protein L11 methyltransferase
MFLWRKFAEHHWLEAHEDPLQTDAHGQLVVVRRPGRRRLELEIVCRSRSHSAAMLKKFGGWIETLPRNWLQRFARADSEPINIGKRLIVVRSANELQRCSVRCPQRSSRHGTRPDALRTAHATARTIQPVLLMIPASLAFGTGGHATTAMSLRLLEQLTRHWKRRWSLVDLGTGSGILALAAKCFGAGQVIGIDNDPAAISMAKSNAKLNKIRGVSFQLGDVRKWDPPRETDVITANLYSHLLIEIPPKLHGGSWLILSGILRSQQDDLVRALKRNLFGIINMKCRGKWVALLARKVSCSVRCPQRSSTRVATYASPLRTRPSRKATARQAAGSTTVRTRILRRS